MSIKICRPVSARDNGTEFMTAMHINVPLCACGPFPLSSSAWH